MSNERKSIYFSSDWHIGHANVIKFDERPFRDLNHMHEVLINNYNSTVQSDGLCYFLGDMGFGSNDTLKRVINRLNGTKVCIIGNHDKGINSFYTAGFDVVMNGAKLVVGGKHVVTMSHCPLVGIWREDTSTMKGAQSGDNWHGEWKHKDRYSWPDMGQFHLHGHCHSKPENRILGKQMDVGVRANAYRPVSISVIESWIGTYGR